MTISYVPVQTIVPLEIGLDSRIFRVIRIVRCRLARSASIFSNSAGQVAEFSSVVAPLT